MSKRFTLAVLALTALVAYLIGAVSSTDISAPVAAGAARPRSEVSDTPRTGLTPLGPVSDTPRTGVAPLGPAGPLVNFADVVEHLNPAVVNIDATSRGVG